MTENLAPLRTIVLEGALGALFGREFKVRVRNGAEAIRALGCQLKGFREYLAQKEGAGIAYNIYYGWRSINPLEELGHPIGDEKMVIAPSPAGAKSGSLFQTILGAALITASFYVPGAGLFGIQTLSAGFFFTMGVGLVLGGVAQMLSPQPNLDVPDSADQQQNKTYNGAVNVSVQGGAVPIAIGRVLIGSSVISGSIETHDGDVYQTGSTADGRPATGFFPSTGVA